MGKSLVSEDVNAYLASYAPSFKAPDGLDRKQWENARRIRISYPSRIRVKTDNIDIKQEGADLARVAFDQTYRADGDPKFTPKTLVMRKIDGKWLIEQELTIAKILNISNLVRFVVVVLDVGWWPAHSCHAM